MPFHFEWNFEVEGSLAREHRHRPRPETKYPRRTTSPALTAHNYAKSPPNLPTTSPSLTGSSSPTTRTTTLSSSCPAFSHNRIGMAGYAELLLAHNDSVLLPDARAHGASDDAIATYGLFECNDIRAWFDWLTKNQHPSCIDALGESMGAAQLLEALAVEPHFCAVVAESCSQIFRKLATTASASFSTLAPGWAERSFAP